MNIFDQTGSAIGEGDTAAVRNEVLGIGFIDFIGIQINGGNASFLKALQLIPVGNAVLIIVTPNTQTGKLRITSINYAVTV